MFPIQSAGNLSILSSWLLLLVFACKSHQKISTIQIKTDLQFPLEEFSKISAYSFNLKDKATVEKYYVELNLLRKNYSKAQKEGDHLFSEEDHAKMRRYSSLTEGESIIDQNGNLAKSAELIHHFTANEIDTLRSILTIESIDFPQEEMDCYYPRDALLFYQKNRLVGYIEICFDCATIKFFPEIDVIIRRKNFLRLQQFMRKIGHEI